MRLLFLNTIGAIGGAERVLLSMIAGLRRADPTIEITLIVGSHGELIYAAQQLGVQVILLALPRSLNQLGDSGLQQGLFSKLRLALKLLQGIPALLQYLRKLRYMIRQIQPTLIHSNTIKTHLAIALLGKSNIPVVWHVHDFYQSRPFVAKLLNRLSHNVQSAIAISNAVARDVKKVLPQTPIKVIYNAVDLSVPISSSGVTRPIKIGLVATFARWKGHDLFLKSAAQVIQTIPDVQFQIIGAPIYHTQGSQFSFVELQTMITQLKLDKAIEFIGFQSETAAIYESLDIVVHASTRPEPFGLVIAEAMAFGKAVIVANAGGAAELVTDQYDAIAVPPGDVQALTEALIDLIQNPQKRQALGRNARRSAIEKFNRDRMTDELLAVYQTLGCFDRTLEIV